ncbi:hypothetical protein ACM66B_003284 [Microbotryomycetes sp. NB124-2]
MLYVASAQPATVQLGAVACEFVATGETSLVVNKLTRLEVYSVSEDGSAIELAFEVPVHATIAVIAPFKQSPHGPSSLLVLTTSMQLFTLAYSGDTANSHVKTTSSVSIYERFGRPAEFQTIVVDPNQSCIVVHAYSGLVRVIPLQYTTLNTSASSRARRGSKRASDAAATLSAATATAEPMIDLSLGFNVRLPELNVTSLALMAGPTTATTVAGSAAGSQADQDDATSSPPLPVLALVHFSHSGSRVLVTHTLDIGAKELVDGPITSTDLADPGSETVIPVDSQDGESGVLVVGEETVTWVPVTSPQTEKKGKRRASSSSVSGPSRVMCRLPVGMIQAWTSASQSNDKFLLGDIYGKLLLLTLTRSPSSGKVVDLTATDIGDTSSPTALVLLSPEILYLASRFGDSQLIRIPDGTLAPARPDTGTCAMDTGEGLQLLESFSSLAPILDCCAVKPATGGPSRVVTCSGAYKGGSLRIVSQGMGITELASLDVEGVQRLWTVSDPTSSTTLLVIGLLHETRFVKLGVSEASDVDDIDEFESQHLSTNQATLHAGSVNGLIVQVCSDKVLYSDVHGTVGGTWSFQKARITHAASAGSFVLLALEGGHLQLLEATGQALAEISKHTLSNEASSISLAELSGQTAALASTWSSNEVAVLSLPQLEVVSSFNAPTTYPVRSIAATTFGDDKSVLFVGFGDGALATYSMATSGKVDTATERVTPLGIKPVELSTFVNKGGKASVFAISDRPTVVSRSNDRLVFSNVNAQNVSVLTSLQGAMPSCVAISDSDTVRIARLDDIRRMDVRTIPLDEEEPRRIAYSARLGVYAVLCMKRDVDRASGRQTSEESVLFFDEEFERIGSFKFETDEGGQSLTCLSVRDEDEDVFVVGTVDNHSDEPEPTKGRLRVFRRGGDDASSFEVSSEVSLPGCPYAVVSVGSENHVAVAVNSQVLVFAVDVRSGSISQVASWGGAFVAFNLAVAQSNSSRLVVGDALRSVTLLDFAASGTSSGATPSLKEVTRDYDAHYMSAVEAVSAQEYIGAETDLNLFTLLHDATGSAQHDDALKPMGRFHLGQMVSKFQRGSLSQSGGGGAVEQAAIKPRLVFATSAGTVGVIVELDAESSKLLSALERNMRQVVSSVGDLDQEAWRSFKSDRQTLSSAGFVDGDFVQKFVELSPEDMERVVQGAGSEHQKLDVGVNEVLKLVEELSRLH